MGNENDKDILKFQGMELEIIAQILDCAGETNVLATRLTEIIRKIDDSAFTVFTLSPGDNIEIQRIVHVCPEEKREFAISANCQSLYNYAKNLDTPALISSADDNIAGKIIAQMGYNLAIAVPLAVSERRLGAIVSVGISNTKNIRHELKLLRLLSQIVSLAVRNSILIERQEELIAEKTWELMKANSELKRKEEEAQAMVIESERSRRALLDALEERQLAQKREEEIKAKMMESQKLESIGRLAGGIAHDFNNALSVIIGYNELILRDMDKSNPLYADLTEVLNAAKKSVGITRQLLAFARKQVIEPIEVNINDAIEKMLKILRRLIGEDIELTWQPGYDVKSVLIDPSQLDQILANLAVNSRDAIEGSGRICIETKNVSFDQKYCASHPDVEPGNYVEITFSDNGCGISKENLLHIFEPFFTTKEVGKGTGLGLATVYGIVHQNKGFIDVESQVGKGTTFRIYFPQFENKNKQEEVLHSNISMGNGETVLLVEDDLQVLWITENMLNSLNYRVIPANNTDLALKAAHEQKDNIKLLITDIVMPGLNGYELALRLQNICPGIKILYMSGYTGDIIAKKGLLAKDMNFMPKPFTIETLSKKVKETIEKNKLE